MHENVVRIGKDQIDPRELLGEVHHQNLQLAIELQCQVVIPLVAVILEHDVHGPLEREAAHRRQPAEGDLACPEPVQLPQERARDTDQEVLVLLDAELGLAASRHRVVVLQEVVGPHADQVDSLGDDLVGLGGAEMSPELPLVFLVVLEFLPEGYHRLHIKASLEDTVVNLHFSYG